MTVTVDSDSNGALQSRQEAPPSRVTLNVTVIGFVASTLEPRTSANERSDENRSAREHTTLQHRFSGVLLNCF